MPLPPALLARLQKRGIVNEETEAKRKRKLEAEQEPEEEIIAEDYDDEANPSDNRRSDGESDDEDRENHRKKREESMKLSVCPNQRNPYHECTDFCSKRWGFKTFNPDKDNERKRRKMMAKFQLPENWVEQPDVWTGRYYYWNLETDEVSWLPPGHPRAKIGLPAKKLTLLRSKLKTVPKPSGVEEEEEEEESGEESEEEEEDDDDRRKRKTTGRDSGSDSGSESDGESKRRDNGTRAAPRETQRDARETMGRIDISGGDRRGAGTPRGSEDRRTESNRDRYGRQGRAGGRGGGKEEALDPMDPASYSDIPRGKWSDGLPTAPAEAKSGVDPTASGVLFQMRPYPSPGAVLRANAAAAQPKEGD